MWVCTLSVGKHRTVFSTPSYPISVCLGRSDWPWGGCGRHCWCVRNDPVLRWHNRAININALTRSGDGSPPNVRLKERGGLSNWRQQVCVWPQCENHKCIFSWSMSQVSELRDDERRWRRGVTIIQTLVYMHVSMSPEVQIKRSVFSSVRSEKYVWNWDLTFHQLIMFWMRVCVCVCVSLCV